jgi:D-glycero-D-manno-heptose 1,7-bisphosphate phosphatase
VFLDRDGTILDELGYLADPDALRLLPGAARGIRQLNDAGLLVVVVTNQSGIARGLFDEDALAAVHERMHAELARSGAHVDAVLHCPHHPELGEPPYRRVCDCRKPAPGLFLRAFEEHGLAPARCAMVGDTERDLEAARRAGVVQRILVLTGKGAATRAELTDAAAVEVADDLERAAGLVLARAS